MPRDFAVYIAGVGVAQQLVRGLALGGGTLAIVAHRDTDAGSDEQLSRGQSERLAERVEDPIRDLGGRVMARFLEEDPELVATEPRGSVRPPQAGADPLRDQREQLVAGGVPKAVVDHLEVVEIDEQDCEPAGGVATHA